MARTEALARVTLEKSLWHLFRTFFGTLVNHIESWSIGPSFKHVFHGYRGGQSLQKKILGDRSLLGEAGGGMLAA